jgi:amidase
MIRPLVAALCAAALVAGPALAASTAVTPDRASIAQLEAQMAAGTLSSQALVRFYLRRIARLDRYGPGLHAVIALNPNALTQARALDRERRVKGPRGPLHGIPILVKDNIQTADPIPTTAGSLALVGNVSGRDAPIIAKLRAAGAVILGKANLSEWANYRSDHSISGWTAVGGLVKNPYALDRSACGSSSGSAAAVAAGLAAAAVGTETDGSVTCPASMNGVVGLKTTLGRLSTVGIVPLAHSQDTPGPFGRSVADAALLFQVMSGGGAPTPVTLSGRRLGVLRFPAGTEMETDAVYAAALKRLRAAGAVLVEVSLPDETAIDKDEGLVLSTEFRVDLNAYLAAAPAAVKTRSLADLIAFNAAKPAEIALFDQSIFLKAEASKGLDDPAYKAALAESKRLAGPEGVAKLIADNHLDALVAPTTGAAWRIDLIDGDHSPAAFSTFPAVAGYPHLSLPMGQAKGAPVGLSFIGVAGDDEKLLALGAAFEQTGPGFVAPTFAPSLDAAIATDPQKAP